MIFFSNNQTASLTGPAGSLLLPPDDEITLKLAQTDYPLSLRSVERTIADYGLQQKTLRA